MKTLMYLRIFSFLILKYMSQAAEIPMVASLEKIATLSKRHYFIEAAGDGLPSTQYGYDIIRLDTLAALLASNNSPPDFLAAFKLVLPNATIAAADPDIIRVVDQSLTPEKLQAFDSPVKINDYSGRVGDLLSSISLVKRTLMLDQVLSFPGPSYKIVEKRNFEVKNFSFTGTLQGLLAALATQIGPSGSYYASLDDSYVIVRFFPFDDK